MKTSNKILLGIFITIIILTTTVHLMVYAKYKRGDYVKFNRNSIIAMSSIDLPALRFVSIKGFGRCAVRHSEKYKLEIQKEKVSPVTYRVVNDTLFIESDPALTFEQLEHGRRNNNPVVIYLPAVVPIKVSYSDIRIGGSIDAASAPSYNIHLGKNTRLSIDFRRIEDTVVHLNELTLKGEHSGVDLASNVILTNLNLQLAQARFNDNGAIIKSMTINADESSTIGLSGKNIKALK